ncbi:MAG: hypothetical protein WCP55_22440, partial [Lentisphaerota bacterium]
MSAVKLWKILRLSIFVFFALSGFAWGSDGIDNEHKSFSFSELGQKATEKADSNSLGIKAIDNGAEIVCRLQALEASVTQSGISIRSTSETEGAGAFNMKVAGLGRANHRLSPAPSEGNIKVSKDCVQIIRPELVEEYTVSGNGIRQDFIVLKRPEGRGELALAVGLTGATAKLCSSGINIRLTETGREFAYSKLLVTDAAGKELSSEFKINSPNEFLVSVDDSSAIYPIRIDPTISDANWVSMGVGLGPNSDVRTIVFDSSNNLYIGGNFTVAGDTLASKIAKWDGSSWSALGSGMNKTVYSLAFDSSGNLYAGGDFTTAGGISANYIAKWNGTTWSALGSGMSGGACTVNSIAFNSGNLYAGGLFTNAGGVSANYIAKWNGSAW